jgi:hypothetical protein
VPIVPIHVAKPTNTFVAGAAIELDDQSELPIVDIGLVRET